MEKPRDLPAVLAAAAVVRLLAATPPGRDRVLLQTTYVAGLRVSEVVRLQIADLNSARHVIHVRQAKGRKDRLVPLSDHLLQELRNYWRVFRPQPWLFPGQTAAGHRSGHRVQKICRRAVGHAGAGQCGFGVRDVVPGGGRAAAGNGGRPALPGSGGRRTGGAAYLGQTLQHHPHVYCVVTGGGLSCNAAGRVDERPRWVACRPGFFLPVRVLSRVYRGKFLALLRQA